MFNSLRSPSPSPCPSPVRDFVSSIKRGTSPRRDKYKTMIESKEPIISRGRLTMNGGFQDFRPYSLEKEDSLESDSGASLSYTSSSRSESCDSNDPIVDPSPAKVQRRFIKIPQKALKNVLQQVSPRLSKKIMQDNKKYEAAIPQNPMWPNVMSTYARGVATTNIEKLVAPAQPSLTAMKARAILDDKKEVRAALQIISQELNQRKMASLSDDSSCTSSAYGSDPEDQEESLQENPTAQAQEADSTEQDPAEDIARTLMEFHIHKPDGLLETEIFPFNPQINVTAPSPNRDTSSEDGFQEESILDALDLDSVPTMTPEELTCQQINEVRNILLWKEYIILETGPPTDSVFV